ncbi:PDR/VanB family oxidoreductase [Rhodoplanes sp. TEM]|uniref:PDR/VanB family oxidoreductase n=1 Tax=Rhodoplanes tepidamans TaxID=200616 RepID=A0ABT5J7M7_RHOTP|nr:MULTISPECIES: PDR/VanB family oxidoreductase [Rhodoplanes]MDC7785637.1 PDR/VanB family oxidoreductase [Rhodoplanes tepidamans]MDC7983278.1 PDR/VanB family oxidoreductase [Rhodoplanes sp. TEM]MDQ0354797.1 vanillate O-demethylase ferredoxin subunit [Rhodoplanes tepidamans]
MARTIRTVVAAAAPAGPATRRLVLTDPDGWELPSFRPGAHVDLHLPGGLVRTYSLVNDPAESDRFVIAVKREPDGRGGSILLHDAVTEGDEIGVSLPRGGLPLCGRHQTFVAGGIGVTPFLSAARALLREGRRDFVLHVVSRGTPPLADEIAPLVEEGCAVLHDTRAAARPAIADLLGPQHPDRRLHCCGPLSLIADFETATADWPDDRVHVERFVPPPVTVPPEACAYTLVLARSGREIAVPLGVGMAEALERHGVRVPCSCGGGICGTCRIDWLEGTPLHRDRALQPAEREHALLACVALSAGPRLVVDL